MGTHMMTRCLDIILSLVGILLLLLMLPWLAIMIKLDTPGPVFYLCNRVGKDGKIFKMFKFRTMHETPVQLGPSVSAHGDPRVTTVGRILRRLKLNEFPQFINVFKGEMTLVGPRPESPDLAEAYPREARKIFSVKPGLVGPNQILGRNEEEWYPPGVDHKRYYIDHILPKKLPLDLQYINDKSFFKDLKYIFLGLMATMTGALRRQHLADNRCQLCMLITDVCLCLCSFFLAHLLRYEGFSLGSNYNQLLKLLPWVVVLRLPVFIYFGFYHTLVRYLTIFDLKKVFTGLVVSSILLATFAFFAGLANNGYARGVFLIDWFCLTTLMIAYRLLLKMLYQGNKAKSEASGNNRKHILIWGAGDAGELCLRYLLNEINPTYDIVGFIDDDLKKRGKKIRGVPVLGDRHHLDILRQLYQVQEVIVAIYAADPYELQRIYATCQNLGLKTRWFRLDAKVVAKPDFFIVNHNNTFTRAVPSFDRLATASKS
ncbi:sugar transferase [Desulfobacca acetoxidans DSM 11109]|uniref:Sugar transferase n=2 Tax=Desulfobacca acetoxidans TaxID=60893 RepID=F2NIJ5_DESAR|nr:sugar transferase [Desulfobacca acetoxidans DSM 11109]